MVVISWVQSEGEGFYRVQADSVFPGAVVQDVYAWVSRSVSRYTLPDIVGAGSGWCRAQLHSVEQDGL